MVNENYSQLIRYEILEKLVTYILLSKFLIKLLHYLPKIILQGISLIPVKIQAIRCKILILNLKHIISNLIIFSLDLGMNRGPFDPETDGIPMCHPKMDLIFFCFKRKQL